jgi:hypothetical protein
MKCFLPKRFQVVVDANPKNSQTIQAQANADVVDDTDV